MKADHLEHLPVLFVVPPHFRIVGEATVAFPLGMGYLVSCLKKVQIPSAIFGMDTYDPLKPGEQFQDNVDANLRWYNYAKKWETYYSVVENLTHPLWREIETVLKLTTPKILGITASVVTIPSVFNIAKLAKQVLPGLRIVVGGAAASTHADYLLANENVDFLVYGEGEVTAVELFSHLLNDGSNPAALREIPGLIYRENGATVRTDPRALIQNLDELPFPDREAVFMLDPQGHPRQLVKPEDILGSRGCPYACKFCCAFAVWGTKKPRFRSVQNILDEFRHLHETYQQKSFLFWDDLFTSNRTRTTEFCEKLIAQGLNLKWTCLVRLDSIDAELLSLMKRAGCQEIQVGIESGNDRVLKYIGKKLTLQRIREKVPALRASGLRWGAFFIVGFPTETKEEIQDTFRLIEEIRPSFVMISIFSPYPGTEFYRELSEQNLVRLEDLKNDTWYPHHNFTGTMSNQEFTAMALEALKYGDVYEDRSINKVKRMLRTVKRAIRAQTKKIRSRLGVARKQ